MARTVVLDDAALAALSANPAARVAFPFLAAGSAGPARRGCCGGVGAAAPSWSRAARQAIAGLPPERLAALKRLLRADTLVLYVPSGGGVAARVTR